MKPRDDPDVTLEQTREKYFSVHFYDALSLAISQFTDQYSFEIPSRHFQRATTIFPARPSKRRRQRQQLQAACMFNGCGSHSLRHKRIQRYGVSFAETGGKTHGQYIEVGAKQRELLVRWKDFRRHSNQ